MNNKFLLYTMLVPFVFIALDSININAMFKKGKIVGAYLFYFFLLISLVYLSGNFIYDFCNIF